VKAAPSTLDVGRDVSTDPATVHHCRVARLRAAFGKDEPPRCPRWASGAAEQGRKGCGLRPIERRPAAWPSPRAWDRELDNNPGAKVRARYGGGRHRGHRQAGTRLMLDMCSGRFDRVRPRATRPERVFQADPLAKPPSTSRCSAGFSGNPGEYIGDGIFDSWDENWARLPPHTARRQALGPA